jgi:hypothetical protein
MFISSHSPLFEFYENFYRVDMNEGRTKVIKAANEERRRLFDRVLPPSDRRAAWLHDENVVILPEYVVETLGVRQGDREKAREDAERTRLCQSYPAGGRVVNRADDLSEAWLADPERPMKPFSALGRPQDGGFERAGATFTLMRYKSCNTQYAVRRETYV